MKLALFSFGFPRKYQMKVNGWDLGLCFEFLDMQEITHFLGFQMIKNLIF